MTCQRENKIRCNEKLHIYTEYSINDIAHITYIGLTKETLKGMIINMKISELLNQEKATLSFEVFPPKKDTDFENVERAASDIAALHPSYMSVTYGAGGSTKGHTIQLAQSIQKQYQVPTIAHLTCVCADHKSIKTALDEMKNAGIEKSDVEYVIDCAEEACGDMNQRGGGNFAKAAAEVAGLVNATGSDARGFCAAPTHALIEAAALVKSGAYKTVVVTAGGCTAKLGMNGKDHVKKGLPILEDCLGGFAVVVSENDGVNPEIDLDMLGRHSVGTGSAPQNVIGSLVADPLDRVGMKITDIDKFSPEMQNPDITKPAGAGDVPLANYKMIGALAVKRGELERKELVNFTKEHGLTGWAPTQGHIPSGVPYIGFAREDILSGKIKNAMIIGKGSLFLGRMTNLFDGVSFVIHGNTAAEEKAASGVSEEEVKGLIAKAMKEFAATLMAE